MRRMALLMVAFLLLGAVRGQQGEGSGGAFRVLFWNVENLFDTVHDEGFSDEEFLPQGERRWTSHRYWQKATEVAKVIVASPSPALPVGARDGKSEGMKNEKFEKDGRYRGEERVPDLVGLCEVENDSVMVLLTRRSVLRELHYDYVMTHSEDARGIDVALLYQPARFRLLESRSLRVASREHGLRPTRDILYAKGLVRSGAGVDTLHVMVVHLPSRAGGSEGDRNRELAAARLWGAVDSVLHTSAAPKVVVMGDFNAALGDRVFRGAPLRTTDDARAQGTYCFRGYWQWLDHVLVSESVVTRQAARPVELPWLLEENKTYGGKMPRRTFRGPTYHGGISDHLPVALDMWFE